MRKKKGSFSVAFLTSMYKLQQTKISLVYAGFTLVSQAADGTIRGSGNRATVGFGAPCAAGQNLQMMGELDTAASITTSGTGRLSDSANEPISHRNQSGWAAQKAK